jgi:hypothetical protein
MNDNCLNLNIWTPGINDGKKRPVMVWFHGGGYTMGSSIEQVAYDGENLSRKGDVVVVTVNHRLNIMGFLDLSAYGPQYKYSGNLRLWVWSHGRFRGGGQVRRRKSFARKNRREPDGESTRGGAHGGRFGNTVPYPDLSVAFGGGHTYIAEWPGSHPKSPGLGAWRLSYAATRFPDVCAGGHADAAATLCGPSQNHRHPGRESEGRS